MIIDKLNKWSYDIFKKSFHNAKLVVYDPKWVFTCSKCNGEWTMGDKDGIEPIFARPYVTCPHCRKKARPKRT
jgi:DNA-directed RNA polymerase subunit RPC12/RpoP